MRNKTTIIKTCMAILLAGAVYAEPVRIVTTTADLAYLAGRITGENAEITALCRGYEDPHFLQAKPGFIIAARNADMWICIGMELEIGWEAPVIEGSRNTGIRPGQPGYLDMSLSPGIIKLEVPDGRITRDMGDVHPSGNPHYWLDPWNGRVMAGAIAERLMRLFPAQKALFDSNLTAFQKELDERIFGQALVEKLGGESLWKAQLAGNLDVLLEENNLTDKLGGWTAALQPLKGKSIVTFHKSWVYFTNRFGMNVAAELEPKPGIPPTAAHLRQVQSLMNAQGVNLILQEPFYSNRAARRVAKGTEAKIVVAASSTGGTKDVTSYAEIFDKVIEALTK